MGNAADEQQIKAQTIKAKNAHDLEVEDLKFVLNSVQGRRFIWRMVAWCGVYRSIADNHSGSMYMNEGIRNVGLKLLADSESASKDLFKQMQKEN